MGLPFASSYTVTTRTAAFGGDGRPTEGSATTQTVQAVVTPLDDRAIQQLPEGLRVRARYRVRTTTDLGDIGEGSSVRIVVEGEEHELQSWGRWNPSSFGGLRHRKYAALRLGS